jgi:hypothetical protein
MKEKLTVIYKITDKDGKTRPRNYNETQWGVNITHTASGEGELCGPGWLHGYHHPLLAVLLNPVHGAYDSETMRLWRCKAVVGIRKADKLGCTRITTVKEIPIPIINTTQKTAFALIVAKDVYKDEKFKIFADNWLSGKDRTADAASRAAYAADAAYAASRAAYAAADAASRAADAASRAAYVADALTDKILLKIARQALKIK